MKQILFYFLLLSTINTFGNSINKLYYNGTVLTLDKNETIAESVFIKDGKIIEVGTNSDLTKKFSDESIEKIDLKGKTIAPGFIDIHSHFMNALRISD